MPVLRFSCHVAAPRDKVFDFYEKVQSLLAITPKKMAFHVSSDHDRMKQGAEVVLHFRILGLVPIRWVKLITLDQAPERFEDVQKSGPLRSWHHKHIFIERGGGTDVVDEVHYELPLGLIGRLADRLFVRRILINMFKHRHQRTLEIFGTAETPSD